MKLSTLALLGLSLAAFGCDDDSDGGGDAAHHHDTDAAHTDDASIIRTLDAAARIDMSVQADMMTQQPDMGFQPPPTGLSSCDEANLVACFSNYDCQDDFEVCLNVGTELDAVPCCYAGDAGQKQAGEACSATVGESECASSICIEGDTGAFCSDRCDTVADCPANMQQCIPIAFSGDDSSWCFPGEAEEE